MSSSTLAETPEPLSFDDGQKKLKRFAALSARKDLAEADLATAIAPLKAAADKKVAPIVAELAALKADLEPWWKLFAERLTDGKKKSAEVAGCVVGSRSSAGKLVFTNGDAKAAIAALRNARLFRFVPRIFVLDTEAVKKTVAAEPEGDLAKLGFKIEKPETFFIDPAVHTGRKP